MNCTRAIPEHGISISLAGLFWVKDNNGGNASPVSVRQIPGNDMVYVKENLEDFAAIAGYLVLNQSLTGRALIGCSLILLGVLMVQLLPTMRKKRA